MTRNRYWVHCSTAIRTPPTRPYRRTCDFIAPGQNLRWDYLIKNGMWMIAVDGNRLGPSRTGFLGPLAFDRVRVRILKTLADCGGQSKVRNPPGVA